MKVNATVFIVRNPFKAVESFYKWSLGSYGGKDAHTNNPPISKFSELINLNIDFKVYMHESL